MASVVDLYTELSKHPGLDFGELRNVARALQTAGLLPVASRRDRMNPPKIGADHCAIFVIALACSGLSGSRTPAALGRRVRKFKKLVHVDASGSRVKLQDELARLINLHRDNDLMNSRDRYLRRIHFIIDDKDPEVDIEWGRFGGNGEPTFERHNYCDARRLNRDASDDYDRKFVILRHASIIDRDALIALRDVLGPFEEPRGDG